MKLFITGVGLWARGLTSFAALERAATVGFSGIQDAVFEQPVPSSIAPRERRRSGLLINLAVEVAHQACEEARVAKEGIASVFASSMGDTATMDYMCRKLAGSDRLLSPSRFTNSVHNAASGYWAISACSREPSTFVGNAGGSVGTGLLEAASQAQDTDKPVLLVVYDVANTRPLSDICPVKESMAAAVVLETSVPVGRDCAMALPVDVRYVAEQAGPPDPMAAELCELAKANPIGQSLALLERCVVDGERWSPLRFPAARYGCVELGFG